MCSFVRELARLTKNHSTSPTTSTTKDITREALLDQQKRQTALLRRLCEANEPEEKAVPKDAVAQQQDEEDFIRLVAER
ncbi:hypothetical protein AWI30_06830 [Enterobacter hormaechei subsp. oharae]|nr:hypothetical protein AWI30_06830 [Enterobacter hormaechei subsp. oharae]